MSIPYKEIIESTLEPNENIVKVYSPDEIGRIIRIVVLVIITVLLLCNYIHGILANMDFLLSRFSITSLLDFIVPPAFIIGVFILVFNNVKYIKFSCITNKRIILFKYLNPEKFDMQLYWYKDIRRIFIDHSYKHDVIAILFNNMEKEEITNISNMTEFCNIANEQLKKFVI